eukprot:364894-Chlamydomonas_euryale.AAC.2
MFTITGVDTLCGGSSNTAAPERSGKVGGVDVWKFGPARELLSRGWPIQARLERALLHLQHDAVLAAVDCFQAGLCGTLRSCLL